MKTPRNRQFGFTLIEMLVVLSILAIVLGVILRQITVVQQRSQTEAVKMDMTQQARESLDLMIHDIHMAGYPNAKMYWSSAYTSPIINNANVAAGCDPSVAGCTGLTSGLVKIQSTTGTAELWLEGDMDGDGSVDVVRYKYCSTAACGGSYPDNGACPCIMRGYTSPKVAGDPTASSVTWHIMVDNLNTNGFQMTAYDATGATVDISSALDIKNNTATIESIKTIAIQMSAKGSSLDMPTQQYPSVVLSGLGQFKN